MSSRRSGRNLPAMPPPLLPRRILPSLDLFELGALPYARLTRGARWHRAAGRMAEQLPPPRDGAALRILDVGAGPAGTAEAMALADPRLQVLALDRSRAMIRLASRHLGPSRTGGRVSLVRGDALALPMAPSTLDGVTGHSLLYLLPDPPRALREFHRVLRPGGRLVLMEPRRGLRLGHLRRMTEPVHVLAMTLWRVVSAWRGRFAPEQLEALLREAGFEVPSVEPVFDGLGLRVTAEKP